MYSLTKYPGKFESNRSQLVAEVVSNCVNDGWAETIGDVEGFGFYAYVKGKRYAWILSEDRNGFVDVETFYEPAQAAKEWDKIQMNYDEYCDEATDEEN